MRRLASAAALALVVALAGASGPAAADGTLRSEVDATRIGLQDQVQLTITVEGVAALPNQIAFPALANLRVVGGPSVSTQMSFVNGASSQSRSWTYALQPTAAGRAQVGPVQATLGGAEQITPAISIEVVAGSVKPAPQRTSNDPFDQMFGRPRRTAEPRLLVEAHPSRSSLYVGEPLLLTYYLYTQTGVSDLQFTEAPQFSGFWVEDLERPAATNGEVTNVDGVTYRRFPVMMKLLFPTKAGRLNVPTSTIRIAVPAQSFFDVGSVIERSTKPVTIVVKAIPDDPGFSGAVGRFKASATLDRSTLALGEAATLRFKVEGTGNLKWVERGPELTVPGAKVFPPQTKSDLKAQTSGIVGSRTWEFVVVPETAGKIEIPSLGFEYFDPSGGGHITRSEAPPLTLQVEAGAPGAAAPAPSPGPSALRRGGPLPLRASLDRSTRSWALSGQMVGLAVVAALLLHGALLLGGRFSHLGPQGGATAAAPRTARGALRELERIGREGMSKEAAAARIEKAMHGVFGSLSDADDERARAVRQLLDEVHQVRYAPQLGDYSEKLRELAARAGDLVRRWA